MNANKSLSGWTPPENEVDPLPDPPGWKQATAEELAAHKRDDAQAALAAAQARIAELEEERDMAKAKVGELKTALARLRVAYGADRTGPSNFTPSPDPAG